MRQYFFSLSLNHMLYLYTKIRKKKKTLINQISPWSTLASLLLVNNFYKRKLGELNESVLLFKLKKKKIFLLGLLCAFGFQFLYFLLWFLFFWLFYFSWNDVIKRIIQHLCKEIF